MSDGLSHRLRGSILTILASAVGVGCTVISGLAKIEMVDEQPPASSDGGPDTPPPATTDDDDVQPPEEKDASVDADVTNPDPGTPPKKRVFVTNAMFGGGSLGGPTGADKLCTDAATNAGLGTSVWRAWLSTTTENAVKRIDPHGPWTLLNGGGDVANNAAELASGALRKAINITETGAVTPDNQAAVWTGTGANGAATSSSTADLCSNWTLAYFTGVVGSSVSNKAQWTNSTNAFCTASARLYCFEQ